MSHPRPARYYRGGYLVGWLIIAVTAMRVILFYQGSSLLVAVLAVALFGLLYAVEPALVARRPWIRLLYFPLQAAVVLFLSSLRPFLDFNTVLFIPLSVQALRAFSRRGGVGLTILFAALLAMAVFRGMEWAEGLSFYLLILAASGFLLSYDRLYSRTQAGQADSEALLADLEQVHQRLQEYALQAEELAAVRERNRLARELHDSVSQMIFSITLTSQSAGLLLERDPARVPELLDRLEGMTSSALGQLRSLIAQLRPPHAS